MGAYLQKQFLFGSYPQEPAERAVADALRSIGGGSEAWDTLRGEGHHFRDVRYSGQRFRGVYSAASGRTRWYAFSPIRWQAAGREGNRLFLRSALVLEALPADGLRYWLNSFFLMTAFQDAGHLLLPDGSAAARCIPERVMIEGRMTRQFFGAGSVQTAICTPYAAAGCDIPLCLRADGVPQPDGIAGVRPVLECIVIE